MFSAVHDAALPISIADLDGIRKRRLAKDNIGVVRCHNSLHRVNPHLGIVAYDYGVLFSNHVSDTSFTWLYQLMKTFPSNFTHKEQQEESAFLVTSNRENC